ncbi:MAG: TIGR04086 family membrane protein [Defluviitaleaceae bacterium]|nr:TIGR04086 family membrane protein [Defluviitaleaceae bacterium]
MSKFSVKFKKGQILSVFMGVVVAYAITAIIFIGTALALTYTSLSEGALPGIVMVACVISVMVAGFDAARKADTRGWLWGMAAGLIYAIIFIIIIMFSSGNMAFDTRKFMLLGLSIVGGGVGGAIGINFKK